VSYVGSQAHHLLVVYSANPGNPALCLALSKPASGSGISNVRPFVEDSTYITAGGQIVNGRAAARPNYHNDDYDASIGNSNYNSLQPALGIPAGSWT